MARMVIPNKRPRYYCRPLNWRNIPAWGSEAGEGESPPSQRPDQQRVTEERLAEFEKEHAQFYQALFEAAWVHRRISAPRQLERGHFEIACETFAVRHLSGDFLCARDTGNATALAIGDIAGKGMGAGMWTTFLAGLFHLHAASAADPAAVAASFNRALCLLHPAAPLATVFFARLDSRLGELIYSSAGHPPALLFRANGAVERLQDGGPLLGAMPHASFNSGRVVFEPGDTLLVYTDGLVECRDAGDREFGLERLIAAARRSLASSAGEMVFSLLGAVNDFAGNQPREDDISVMVLRDSRPSRWLARRQ